MKPGDLITFKEHPHFAWLAARENFGVGTVVEVEHTGRYCRVYAFWSKIQEVEVHSIKHLEVISNDV